MEQTLFNITPDFSEAKSFMPFPDGTFLAKVIDIKGEKSKAGNDMINWQYEILDDAPYKDPADGSTQSRKGRRLFNGTPATGKGAGFLKEALLALGFKDPSKFRFPASKAELMGRRVYVITTRDTYNPEKPKNKITGFKVAEQA